MNNVLDAERQDKGRDKWVEEISELVSLDKEEQVKSVMENPSKLQYLSIELQLEILEQSPMLIEYASWKVVDHKDFINKLIIKEPRILQDIKIGYNISEKCLKETIAQNPFAIQYVEEYVGQKLHQPTYEYVSIAVRSNPEALNAVSSGEQLRLINSVSDGEELLKYATKNVQKTMIVDVNPSYLAYASPEVRNDDEIVRRAVAKNPSMYKYASDRLRDDIEVQRVAVNGDFNVYKMLPMEAKQNPEFEPQREKVSIVDKFVFGAIKLEDIDKQNFVDINFYNTIVQESKNKVLRQFDSLTQGMEMNDKIEEKLQAQVEKKLKQVENKLHKQRNWALFKNGIKTKIDGIVEDFNRGFQAGQVANEIKHMEL